MTDYPEASTDQDMYITDAMAEEIVTVLDPSNKHKYADWYVREMCRQMAVYLAQSVREDGPLALEDEPRLMLVHGGMHV